MSTRFWRDEAACSWLEPDEADQTFYPDQTGAGDIWAKARTLCTGCPVRQSCLDEEMAVEHVTARQGMRGGLTPKERASVYRKLPTLAARRIEDDEPTPAIEDVA